ncbi:hypothetical protein [Maricaulis sp.]|uniref:hypothetical protein n=1 Tax=Maricaulis sp. TaxID=1486257 RepID=UPI002605089C|nr:hypothetical protein [Maricaulis sp.]
MIGRVTLYRGYVLLEHEHVSDFAEVLDRISAAKQLFDQGAPHRLLVDARYYIPVWKPEEAPRIAAAVLDAFPPTLRIAVLIKEQSTLVAVKPIMERLVVHGVTLNRFTSPDEAKTWLLNPDEAVPAVPQG